MLGLACSCADEGLGLVGSEGVAATLGGVENSARDTDDSPPLPPSPSMTPAAAIATPCRVVVSEASSLIRASAQRLEESCYKIGTNHMNEIQSKLALECETMRDDLFAGRYNDTKVERCDMGGSC